MIAYCGLDCAKCEGYLATQANDQKQIAEVAKKWSVQFNADVRPEHVLCDGCGAGGRESYHCANLCEIKKCCVSKKYESCIVCADFPCAHESFIIDNVPSAKANLERKKNDGVVLPKSI